MIISDKKYLKVMFGSESFANGSGIQYKIDELNIADYWNPNDDNPEKTGGFNFSTEDKIFRWLVRGDTIYDVEIPEDAEIINVESSSAPNGVFRANKIILSNPRIVTDDIAMYLYKKSDLPEKSYFKALAGCSVRGYINTSKLLVNEKINKDNIVLALAEFNDFIKPDPNHTQSGDSESVKEILTMLDNIKENGDI